MTQRRVRCRSTQLLLAALLGGAVAAQSPSGDPAQVPASTLLQRLSARDLPVADARGIADDLGARSIAVGIDLFDALRAAYGDRRQDCDKERERLGKQFAKAVAETQRALLARAGETAVERLRREALAVSAREDLTESMIRAEMDPRLAELRSIVLPAEEQVFAHDPDLAAAAGAARRHLAELDQWYDLCLEAAGHLDADPAGRKHAEKARPLPSPPSPTQLTADFARACVLALPLAARDQTALEDNEALRAGTDPAEFAGTLELNRIRIALGLPALRIDERLGQAARDHSHDMDTLGFFSHTSPVEGKRTFGDRASRAGTSASAENIAAGHSRGEGAVLAWWYSPGHHKNMLGSHGRTGLGRSGQTWTQMFGG